MSVSTAPLYAIASDIRSIQCNAAASAKVFTDAPEDAEVILRCALGALANIAERFEAAAVALEAEAERIRAGIDADVAEARAAHIRRIDAMFAPDLDRASPASEPIPARAA